MTPSSRRSAAWFLVCMALLVAQAANAATPKFTPLLPKSPNAQAQIAARNQAAMATYQSFYATKKGDWRKNPDFLKALRDAKTTANPTVELPANKLSPALDSNLAALVAKRQAGSFAASSSLESSSTTVRAQSAGALVSGSASTSFGGFLAAPSYQTIQLPVNGGNWVTATATADLNNDGYPDLVSVDVPGNLNVLLNDGHGGFLPPVINKGGEQYAVGADSVPTPPVWITPGDVNGDGLVDLVVTVWGRYLEGFPDGPELLVYLNKGNGNFSAPIVVNPTLGPTEQLSAIVVSDRDGDGKADIVVVSYNEIDHFDAGGNFVSWDTDIAVQTLYSNGDGTFTNGANISHYLYPGYSIIIPNGGAQFVTLSGTKYLALECEAYANSGGLAQLAGVSVLFFQDSNGGRSSQPVASPPTQQVDFGSNTGFANTYSNGLSLADVNGDGIPDITLSFGDFYLYGALGTSGGGFAAPQLIENGNLPFQPSGWALVDLNGDGIPDMIDMEAFYIQIWLGKGDGTFADPKALYSSSINNSAYIGTFPGNNLVAADFDRDGIIDFATNDSSVVVYHGRTAVFKGYGDGTFAAAPALGPFNGDPTPDTMGEPWVLDLNGDGLSDIVSVNYFNAPNALETRLVTGISDGKGHFTYTSTALSPGENGFKFLYIAGVGDFNGDGFQDVLLAGLQTGNTFNGIPTYCLAVALSKGDGTFANPVVVNTGVTTFLRPTRVVVGDINHDGILDIVQITPGERFGMQVHNRSGFLVSLGNGDGTFNSLSYTAYGTALTYGALADFNGDGFLDLAVYDIGAATVTVLPGDMNGVFSTTAGIPVANDVTAVKIITLDANNDGKTDLAILNWGAPSGDGTDADLQVYINDGNGNFVLRAMPEFGYNDPDIDLISADFNGDGCPDLFSSEWSPGYATRDFYSGHVLLGNCDGTFQQPQSILLPPDSMYLSVGKFTPDGALGITGWSYYGPNFILFNQAGANISVTASEAKITQGNSVSLTAAVSSTWPGRPMPGGTVSFYDNGTLLGSQSVIAGTASLSTFGLATGSHLITVSYSGDENFNPHKDAAYTSVAVTAAPAPQAEITISSPVSSLTLHQGDTQTVTLTLSGSANYTGNVSFKVSGATGGLGVTVNPATVSLTNGALTTVSVVVTTNPGTTAALAHPLPRWLGVTFGATAFGAFFLGIGSRRRKSLWVCLLIVLCMTLCMMSVACGGSGSSNHFAKAGTSTIVVTATPAVSGASVQTTTFTVTVQ